MSGADGRLEDRNGKKVGYFPPSVFALGRVPGHDSFIPVASTSIRQLPPLQSQLPLGSSCPPSSPCQ